MELPLEKQLSILKGYSVYYFKDKRFSKESPPHRYIVIPTDDDFYLILCIITSQIESRSENYARKNKLCLNSLVHLEPHDMPWCITTKCIVDCNQAEYLHKGELVKIIEPNTFNFWTDPIPEDIKTQVLIGIDKSPVIAKYIKNKINKN